MAAIVHNSGVNSTLYYNVMNYFKGIMSNHPSIASVSQGSISDFDIEQYPAYPVGNVSIFGTSFGTSTSDFSVQLIVADKQKLLNNESSGSRNTQIIPFYGTDDVVDIHANTLAILNDLTSYTQRSVDGFEINDDIVCEPFSDRFNNGLAGWLATFTLTVHNNKNRCLFPLVPSSGSGYTIQNCATSQSYNVVLSGSASVGNIFNSTYPDVTSCYRVTGTLTDFDSWDLVNLPVLNIYGSCVACANAQTTTTTSTTSTTSTTTTAAPTTTTTTAEPTTTTTSTSTTTTAAPTTTTTSTTSTTTTAAPTTTTTSTTSTTSTTTTSTTTTTAAPTTTTTSTTSTTTTTAGPATTTTTLAPGIYNFYESVACCDTGSTSNVAIQSGSIWYKPGGSQAGNVIGMVYYNPTTDRCEQIKVSSSVSIPSFVINSGNEFTYTYGSGSDQCNKCQIIGGHTCSGSICYSYSFQNSSTTSVGKVFIANCDGTAATLFIDPLATVFTCSIALPVPDSGGLTITNLGVCGSTTTTTAGPSTAYRAVGCCDSQSYYVAWTADVTLGQGVPLNQTIYNPTVSQCMKIVENVTTQSVSFTITNANYTTYTYGYDGYPNEQCIVCVESNPC